MLQRFFCICMFGQIEDSVLVRIFGVCCESPDRGDLPSDTQAQKGQDALDPALDSALWPPDRSAPAAPALTGHFLSAACRSR